MAKDITSVNSVRFNSDHRMVRYKLKIDKRKEDYEKKEYKKYGLLKAFEVVSYSCSCRILLMQKKQILLISTVNNVAMKISE